MPRLQTVTKDGAMLIVEILPKTKPVIYFRVGSRADANALAADLIGMTDLGLASATALREAAAPRDSRKDDDLSPEAERVLELKDIALQLLTLANAQAGGAELSDTEKAILEDLGKKLS